MTTEAQATPESPKKSSTKNIVIAVVIVMALALVGDHFSTKIVSGGAVETKDSVAVIVPVVDTTIKAVSTAVATTTVAVKADTTKVKK